MRKLISVSIICLFASCGWFRKVNKGKTLDKLDFSVISKFDSSGVTVDRSVTVIHERTDTTFDIAGKTIKQDTYLHMDSLIKGMTAVQNDLLDVRLVLNPFTGVLSAEANLKPQQIQVGLDKHTTITNDIIRSATKSESFKNEATELHETTVVQKAADNSFWIVIIVLGLVVSAIFVFRKVIRQS